MGMTIVHGHCTRKSGVTSTYRTWQGMLNRCRNRKKRQYQDYGGRGISVCERWASFEMFLSDMGERPSPKHTLDRIDNDGNYEPGNCRWATYSEQARNSRRTRWLTVGDETMVLTDWAKRSGICDVTIYKRLQRGWSAERAVWDPPIPRNQRRRAPSQRRDRALAVSCVRRNT